MKKRSTQWTSLLLALALFVGFAPLGWTPAYGALPPGLAAAGVVVGTGSTLRESTTEVGFGGKRWYVVGYDGQGVNKGAGTITLLATAVMGDTKFSSDGNANYQGSLLQAAVNALPAAYDARERALMAALTLDGVLGAQPTGQTVWAPSNAEMQLVSPDVRKLGTDNAWWLRTPNGAFYAGYVYDGIINQYMGPIGTMTYSVRPATAVNLTNVLFATPIVGAKDGAVGALTAVSPNRAIKFTIQDNANLSLAVASPPASVTQAPDSTLSLTFSGARTGADKYVSCALVSQTDGMVKYYAKLSSAASGTLTIPFPAGIQAGSYKLMIFNEQIVAGDRSDYASAPVAVNVTMLGAANRAPSLKPGVPSTATATVPVGSPYTVKLSDLFEDIDGNTLSYRVSINSAPAAAASEDYSFTPIAAGTTTLAFTAYDGVAESASHTVTLTASSVSVTSIAVSGAGGVTCVLRSGQLQLSALVQPANATNKNLTWTCSVANGGPFASGSIDAAAVLRLTSIEQNGTVTVRATAQDGSGIYGQLQLNIIETMVSGISVTTAATNIVVGTPVTMQATVTPAGATQAVTWSVSQGADKASVSPTGVLSPTAAGSITVRATAVDGSAVFGEANLVARGTQATPGAPTLIAKTASSVTLTVIAGAEYSKDGTTWQNSATFTGLAPNTAYSFTARMKETGTLYASPASVALSVTTDRAALAGSVAINGTHVYGQTLTADTEGLSSTPTVALGTLTYRWTRDGSSIPGATGGSYSLVTEDVGKVINVTVDAANCSGSVVSANAVQVAKAQPSYTPPAGLVAIYGQTLASVALPSGFSWESGLTTSVGNAGSRSFNVTFTPVDTANYSPVVGIPVTIAVGKAQPSYSAPTGLTAIYGQTLTDVSLPSGFSWESGLSTSVGNAGSRSFNVTFTPTDTANYNPVTGIPVAVAVGKAQPSYSTPIGLIATYGQTLANVALPTGFSWEGSLSTAVGTAGSHSFSATFTPTDTANHNPVTGIPVTITVGKAQPPYTTPTGLIATYGQTLAAVSLPTGFSWEDGLSTAVGTAGSHSFSATFTPTDTANYNPVTGVPVAVEVGKAQPSYSTPTGLVATYGQTLANVALPTGFSWEGNLSTPVGTAGSHSFNATFTPADTANYSPVTGIPVTIAVGKAQPSYSAPTGLAATYGQTLAVVSLPSGFSWEAALTTSVGSAGSRSFMATFTPADTANYNPVAGIPVTIAVAKAQPSYSTPTGLVATYGQTLADVTLPTGFSWEDGSSTSAGDVGSNSFTVMLTPADTDNYKTVSGISVTIAVSRAAPTIAVDPAASSILTGSALSSSTLIGGSVTGPGGTVLAGIFTWSTPTQVITASGSYEATFTPDDPARYEAVKVMVPVAVTQHEDPDDTQITITPDLEPDQPVTANVAVTPATDAGGHSSATIPDQTVAEAIARAESVAVAQGPAANGISVALTLNTPDEASSLGVTLSQNALQSLTDAQVQRLDVGGGMVSLSLDLESLREIQRQSGGDLTITVTPAADVSTAALALIGARPVYNLTIGYLRDGAPATVTSLNQGSATLSLPYTPGRNEAVAYLFAVYVDDNGNVSRVPGSSYDANTQSILFATDHFSVYGVGYMAPTAKFTDVAAHWARESVDYVVGRGLFSGTADSAFSPDAAMSRGMLVTVLGRLAGVDVSSLTVSSFTDVKAGSYYLPYVEWAYGKGIVSGVGNRQFAPERPVTREEIAVMLQNFARATGYTLPAIREAVTFADSAGISGWSREAVKALQLAGVLAGKENNEYAPRANATRAQVATALERYVRLTIDPVTAQGWAKRDDGQWTYYEQGKSLTGWQTIAGKRFCFSSTGAMLTGWKRDASGAWAYLSTGGAVTGWQEIDGSWYYFYDDGSLAIKTRVDGYEVDENGVRR